MRLAGAVVLYNPDNGVYYNINKYLSEVEKLYVVDNSEIINEKLVKKLISNTKIKYVNNDGNKGIASALNVAADRADKDNFKWLLMMDQDSYFPKAILKTFKDYLIGIAKEKTAIVAATPVDLERDIVNDAAKNEENIMHVITSGSILNLEIYKKIGGFLDDWFIYVVDFEYCWRAKKNGFDIIRLPFINFIHNTNNYQWKNEKKICIHDYSPIAYYYAIRNNMYLIKKYRKVFPKKCLRRLYDALKYWFCLALKERNSMKKIRYMVRGYADYRKGILGKYKDR